MQNLSEVPNTEIELRLYNPETDKNFIFSTFLEGLYHGNDFYRAMESSTYYKNYATVLEALLARTSVNVVIACLSDDKDVILGYAILENKAAGEPNTLHYSFVKKAWRNKGIARSMVPNTTKIVTHITKPGLAIAKKKGWVFDPFSI